MKAMAQTPYAKELEQSGFKMEPLKSLVLNRNIAQKCCQSALAKSSDTEVDQSTQPPRTDCDDVESRLPMSAQRIHHNEGSASMEIFPVSSMS
mmetsp:Transcript_10251/g.12793  ORF Transcript_10251/g.12793 Transcript_10251/m.12793 type:complete len:93 (-) Transcript_10251:501-779(-)|eukprot:CAMPEP_0170471968 /NCGR_PEP_ID=MMETSP0123-20130129/14083_1 /TAXON_ID=182087 /ORGANISM="Favella ehrenbergii, Strain Fehren 1" /LENGTH=92 /DNA_ID=CAMNT_0010739937 /DNA_START=774 /DNA_END=1052 /DNA_ORIENTATION=-